MKRIILLYFLILFFAACKNQPKEMAVVSNEPKVIQTTGFLISKDSISEPEIVAAGKPKLLSFDNSVSVPAANNIYPSGIPKIIFAGKPYVATPGTAIFLAPEIRKAKGKIVPCIQPEPIAAQRPRFKDNASFNIQYLDVDQGLPSSYVHKIYEDKFGNMWICGSTILAKYDGKSFTTYSAKEGFIAENLVRAILEDKNGNMWFASSQGICKYDGKTFTHYDERNGLPDNFASAIIADKNGELWFATNKGICKFDGNNFTCYSEKQGLIDDRASCLLLDKLGNIWVGTQMGVSKFDGKRFVSYTIDEGLVSNNILSIAEDKEGSIWFSSEIGVCKFKENIFSHYSNKEGLLSGGARNMISDKDGNIWIAAYGAGVSKFDGKNFTYLTEKEGLTINLVWTVMEDRAGNIWIGTDGGGLCKYSSRSFSHFTEKQGMGKIIMSIGEDKSENIWMGGYAAGLWRYDGKTFTLFKDGLNVTSTVKSIMQDRSGNMWFGTETGGLIKYNGKVFELYTIKEGLSSNNILCMLEDKEGNLWIGTAGKGLNKFDGKNFIQFTIAQGLCSDHIRGILQDKNGDIWVGTGKGLNKISEKSVFSFTEKEGLSSNNLKNIIEDSNGNIWIGTNGSGLNKYDGKSITIYSVKEGLSNNFIRSLIEDKPQNMPKGMVGIWASTDNGIDHILVGNKRFSDTDSSVQEVKINVYRREDGLKGEDFTSNSGYQDSKSRIWWGSVKSLTMLDALNVKSENVIPKINLDNIYLEQKFIDFRSLEDSIKNKKDWYVGEKNDVNLSRITFTSVPAFYNYPQNLELPYDISNITFNFSAVDWNAPTKIKYQFILEGSDKEWNPITSETKATYTNLGSGNYTFKVKAKGFSDIWSEPFEYHFMIHPPWWQTISAYIIYFLVFVFGTFMVFKWRTKALIDRQKELEITIDERTADVVEEKNKVIEKNLIIENKQKEIIDSILYARRIQNSLLPTEKYIEGVLNRLTKKNKKQ